MKTSRLGSSHLAAVWLLGAAAALPGCETEPAPAFDGQVRTVSVSELVAMADDAPTVVDVRELASFEDGHIEGSVWIDSGALRASIDGVDGQVVSRESAAAVFGKAGLSPSDSVVILAADNGTHPSRVAWTLRYYGHEGPVGLLDGGLAAWTAEGMDVQPGTVSALPADYVGVSTRDPLRVDKAWMLEHLDDDQVVIFDVRTPEEFAEGHIPSAVHVNWTTNLDDDGGFVTDDEVRRLHGEPKAPTLVTYCRTGSRAAVSWALLARAGYADVRLYDGSWTEWSLDPDTPKDK